MKVVPPSKRRLTSSLGTGRRSSCLPDSNLRNSYSTASAIKCAASSKSLAHQMASYEFSSLDIRSPSSSLRNSCYKICAFTLALRTLARCYNDSTSSFLTKCCGTAYTYTADLSAVSCSSVTLRRRASRCCFCDSRCKCKSS